MRQRTPRWKTTSKVSSFSQAPWVVFTSVVSHVTRTRRLQQRTPPEHGADSDTRAPACFALDHGWPRHHTATMTMITHAVNSLQQCADLPEGPECLGRGPSLFGDEKTRSMQNKLNNAFRSELLPVEVKWVCMCVRKELRFTQDEYVSRNPGCCSLDECPCCSCLGFAELQLSIRWERMSSVPSSLVSSSYWP